MDTRGFTQRLAYDFWLSALLGLILTMASAFLSRFFPHASVLQCFGIEAPLGPLATVIVNSLAVFVFLSLRSRFGHSKAPRDGLEMFILFAQVFVGIVIGIYLSGIRQSIHFGYWRKDLEPVGTGELLVEEGLGQALAYFARKLVCRERREAKP